MILLDTNICIYIINARPPAVLARFQQYRMGDIGICSLVATELAYGVAKSGSARNRQALEMFLAPLTVLPFDDAAAWEFSEPMMPTRIIPSPPQTSSKGDSCGGIPR